MTQVLSPTAFTSHHGTDEQNDAHDEHGSVFLPEQSIALNLDPLEDLLESPLSSFAIDPSSPPVSPLSNHQESSSRATHRRRAAPRGFTRQSTSLTDSAPVELPVIALLLAAFKRTGLGCKTSLNDIVKMDIGWPTNVRHIAHVTFDRFNGFLGLPVEFELEVPRRVPSASASVFGVSAESMQCSYDQKGNSVPTILLLLQERLYDQGGLQAEGIFRINAENGQEEQVRDQLNKGIVPYDVDVHCLAGLIKAWFRELPKGVLDNLTPEQVMECHTEDQCVALVSMLPPTQAALLSWAINLMADVVQEERYNKMNARNIAMVFAPNMTQMSDPLTALMHAVQVMNLLKTLILKTIRDREGSALNPVSTSSCKHFKDTHGHGDAYIQKGATMLEQSEIEVEKEACFLKASEALDEFNSARGSDDMFSRYCSAREITDEDEVSLDSQGPFSYASSTLDNMDNDTMAAIPHKIVHNRTGSGADLSSYLSKVHLTPFRLNQNSRNKTSRSSRESKSFAQCGVLESLSFKGKAKSGRMGGKVDQQDESIESW